MTVQAVCAQNAPKCIQTHQKSPKATNCVRITRLQTMHQSAQNAQKWPYCTKVYKMHRSAKQLQQLTDTIWKLNHARLINDEEYR